MALANAAVLFSRQGGEVLTMDWDLEAPGLHRFFDHPAWSNGEARLGTIDLLYDLAALVHRGGARLDEESTRALVGEIDLARYAVTIGTGLSVMWAGQSDETRYAQRVSAFDWDGLYQRAPFLFSALARALSERYRYVLIDSRTGVTDTSGVCTAALPEKLVVVFTPNNQSLDGALHRVRTAVTYRRQSDDLRPLVVYPLASRVELSEDELRRDWRHGDQGGVPTADRGSGHRYGYQPRFQDLFSEIYGLPECDLQAWFDEVQIQHSTRYAYGEAIAVNEEGSMADRLSLARSYAGFARALDQADAPWKVERQDDARRQAEDEQTKTAFERLESERRLHEQRAVRGRRLLLMVRLYQVVGLAASVAATNVLGVGALALLTGGVVVIGLEVLAIALGFTHWRRHADLAAALNEEEYRYRTGTRGYEDIAGRGRLLAERVDSTIGAAYKGWNDRTGLAPPPSSLSRRR